MSHEEVKGQQFTNTTKCAEIVCEIQVGHERIQLEPGVKLLLLYLSRTCAQELGPGCKVHRIGLRNGITNSSMHTLMADVPSVLIEP